MTQDDEAKGTHAGRRKFMLTGIGVMGAGVGAIVAAPALPFVGFPLFEETTSGSDDFIAAGKPSQFSGTPVKVDLFSDRVDAWNRVENVKIGSAWVVEHDGELVAFSTVCPHLGCAIDYDTEVGKFKCPCHRSWFTLSGEVEEGPSPRGLDQLEVKSEDKLVAIRHQRFKQGITSKEPVT
jgi:menaquinol-cytochrome c reductase iron-sulfur subunit